MLLIPYRINDDFAEGCYLTTQKQHITFYSEGRGIRILKILGLDS